ncbi:MAG: phosphate starvation-inducible protein PhoH [Alphaproteobacteria bacterium CG_4_10_14_0_8_um_filter_53_9]|nr:MAG: phosphate starvation-inducible protein PhoH [Alphaproteobacteria bacterium CG_4_10_14_0_8_um_filter_53_9]
MSEPKPQQIVFDSNTLLQDLCGRHDGHLQLIEDRLGVQLVARGNQVSIFGPPEQADKAIKVLEDLYEFLEKGVALSPSQVEATLRINDSLLDPTARATDMLTGGTTIVTPQAKVMPRSKAQEKYVRCLKKSSLVFGAGPAGTGKTFLAAAAAVELLTQRKVSKLVLTRPVVEAGERLGFLPGTFEEKIDPYLRPLFDALDDTLGRERWTKMRETGVIEIAPLAYMRGRTLHDSVLLLDEAQNTTPVQMKMFLTRLGENSRMFVSGDPTQCDLPPRMRNGLVDALSALEGVREIDVVRFEDSDVVRHPLVSTIVSAYAQRDRQLQMKLDE